MDRPAPAAGELSSVEQAIAVLEGQRVVLGDQVVDTALAPLLDKRDRLRAAALGGQRKLVTVLFADLVDFTVASQQLDAEDLRLIVARYFAAARAAIETEGGVVEKFIGDAVMAVFGLHRAREDDPQRAVRAALAMRRALEEVSFEAQSVHGIQMRMRVGIDTGEVLVSGLDERAAGEFVVVGETVNRAARLQAAAPPDGILLSADTCRHVRGSFGLRRVQGLRLKGIADPVDGYLVESEATQGFWPETRGVEGVTTRTIGRELELGSLQKIFADVVEDRAWKIVTVVGEAGVGKSRVVQEFETWLAGLAEEIWVLRGRAAPTTQDVANGLLRSVFAERLGIQDTDAPAAVRRKWGTGIVELIGGREDSARAAETVATWLGFAIGDAHGVAGGRDDPEALRRRAGRIVLDVLGGLAERAPVVILLEDLHWADSASLDWLEELASAQQDYSLLVLATTRPALLEQRPHWGEGLELHTSLRLEPLSRRESRVLLSEILQHVDQVPDALAQMVVATAEGNPFYIEELVKWLVEEGVIQTGASSWRVVEEALRTIQVPSTLRGLLQARLDSLHPTERSVLERGSVVGRVFWDRAVARLAGSSSETAADQAFEQLRSREVVFQRPRSTFEGTREFSFRHALMRDVAYEGVLRSARRRYHALAAQWLEEVAEQSQRPDEYAASVAHHHEEAGDRSAAAVSYLRAGRHAAGTFAGEDALRLLSRAGRLAPPEDKALRCDVLLAREDILDRLARRPEQRATLDELAAMQGLDPARAAQVRLSESRWGFVHGEYGPASAGGREAAGLARRAGRDDLEVEALLMEGKSLAFLSEHAQARRVLERALERARAMGDHRRAGETLRLLGVVATNLGENEEALERIEEARTEHRRLADREGVAMATGQLGALFINMGRLEDAKMALEEALTTFVATGHRLREGVMLGNLATVAMDQGRLDDALTYARRTLALTKEIDDPEGIASSFVRLGDVYRLTGDYANAREHLERGLEVSRDHGLHYFTAHLLCSLAALDLTEGRMEASIAHAAEAQEPARLADIPHAAARALLVAGMARAAVGDRTAVELLQEAAERYAMLGLQAEWLESRSVLAVAILESGDVEAALQIVREVLPGLHSGGTPGSVEPGRVLADVHRVLDAAGDIGAGDLARRAGAFLQERSTQIRDDRLRTGFLSTPVNVELVRIAASAPLG